MKPKNALLTVAKRPTAGSTKTRLSPPLSPGDAAALYECLLKDTIELMRQVPETQRVLVYLPEKEEPYFCKLAPDFDRLVQVGEDLGSRLDKATSHYLRLGYENVVIMGSDSPTLPSDHLVSAFRALAGGSDIVLGPCEDGGYYLIGFKQPLPRLFREVRMSTEDVTFQTLALASELNLHVHLLPRWYDVDDAESLAYLLTELAQAPEATARHTRQFLSQNPVRFSLPALPTAK